MGYIKILYKIKEQFALLYMEGVRNKMRTIQVDYEAVATKLSQMQAHIKTNITNAVADEYRQIQNNLMQVDGETQNLLQQAMELNRQKAITCTSVVDRLLGFMSNASRQMQVSEEQIARAFSIPRRG